MTSPLNNLTDTWANGATVFTGLKYNITNTASAAGSALCDFQISGTSKFNVQPTLVSLFAGMTVSGGLQFETAGVYWTIPSLNVNSGLLISDGSRHGLGKFNLFSGVPALMLDSAGGLLWSTGDVNQTTFDIFLTRDAAGILAQRNSTNAQTLRVYNTYTDASNYERGVFDWTTTSNLLTIAAQAAGTGTLRPLKLVGTSSGGGTSSITVGGATIPGCVDMGFPGAGIFRSVELSLAGSSDIFFQAVPSSTSGFGYLEAYASAGLILGTGGNANPIILKIDRSEIARFVGSTTTSGLKLVPRTFANAPTAAEGTIAAFTDSTTATWRATITGSGSNHVLGYYNGTNWTVMG